MRSLKRVPVGVLVVMSAACSSRPAPSNPATLTPSTHLVRTSLALRGTRPSLEELEAVRQDPSKLDRVIDSYLETSEFGETMRYLHNEALLVRTQMQDYPFGFPSWPPLERKTGFAINGSLQDAPLRFIEHVIMNDRPYTEIVTADYTLANKAVADVWGLEYHGAVGRDRPYDTDSEWVVTHWPDDRPAAGILSDSGLMTRYTSNGINANRSRANAFSKILLCYDFLSREVVIDGSVNLADPAAVNNAVVTNPTCASCHHTLDPIAQHFLPYFVEPFGYLLFSQSKDNPTYPHRGLYAGRSPLGNPETARRSGTRGTNRDPGFFGLAAKDVGEVGRLIAEDPRFALCAAKRFYAYLAHVDLESVPKETAAELQRGFIESGYNAKALAKAVVLSEGFKSGGLRKLRPEQLARLIEDLTGFRWRFFEQTMTLTLSQGGPVVSPSQDVVDALDEDSVGYRVLAGGIDSYYVVRPASTVNVTTSLVLRELAARSARYVVDADFSEPDRDKRHLLSKIEATETLEEQIRGQLARLHLRIFGERFEADSEPVSETYALFQSALELAGGEPKDAWVTILTAMLQDIRIIYD